MSDCTDPRLMLCVAQFINSFVTAHHSLFRNEEDWPMLLAECTNTSTSVVIEQLKSAPIYCVSYLCVVSSAVSVACQLYNSGILS